MKTVVETEDFRRFADKVWGRKEREEFISWIAANPLSGDIIPGTRGLRKVRCSRSGMGKRGGTRVIYYNVEAEGQIWLLLVYAKAKFDNLPAEYLAKLKEVMNDG